MIKRQYFPSNQRTDYFNNFLCSFSEYTDLAAKLAEYGAKLGKSKNYTINVKWYNHEKYEIFVLRWS